MLTLAEKNAVLDELAFMVSSEALRYSSEERLDFLPSDTDRTDKACGNGFIADNKKCKINQPVSNQFKKALPSPELVKRVGTIVGQAVITSAVSYGMNTSLAKSLTNGSVGAIADLVEFAKSGESVTPANMAVFFIKKLISNSIQQALAPGALEDIVSAPIRKLTEKLSKKGANIDEIANSLSDQANTVKEAIDAIDEDDEDDRTDAVDELTQEQGNAFLDLILAAIWVQEQESRQDSEPVRFDGYEWHFDAKGKVSCKKGMFCIGETGIGSCVSKAKAKKGCNINVPKASQQKLKAVSSKVKKKESSDKLKASTVKNKKEFIDQNMDDFEEWSTHEENSDSDSIRLLTNTLVTQKVISKAMKSPKDYRGYRDSKGNLQAAANISKKRDHIFVENLAIAPWNIDKKGKKTVKGIGVKAISAIVQESVDSGFGGSIKLKAPASSRQFYTKMGFEIERSPNIFNRTIGLSLPPSKATQFLSGG